MPRQSQVGKVFILIASRFDEAAVVSCSCQMREQGLEVQLVGLIPGSIRGQHGLTVDPDLSLTDLEKNKVLTRAKPLVIIPGGAENAALLFSDPRVHRICETAVQEAGWLAPLLPAQPTVAASGAIGNPSSGHLIEQNDMDIAEFVEHLIRLLKTNLVNNS